MRLSSEIYYYIIFFLSQDIYVLINFRLTNGLCKRLVQKCIIDPFNHFNTALI